MPLRPRVSDKKVAQVLRECGGNMSEAARKCGYKSVNTFIARVNQTPRLRDAKEAGIHEVLGTSFENVLRRVKAESDPKCDDISVSKWAIKEFRNTPAGVQLGIAEPGAAAVRRPDGADAIEMSDAQLVAIIEQARITVVRKKGQGQFSPSKSNGSVIEVEGEVEG